MAARPLEGKSVLMIIARQSFRDEELNVPRDVLKQAGAKVIVASRGIQESVGMLHQVRVRPDLTLEQVDPAAYDAVLFVGGTGAREYFDNRLAHQIAVKAHEAGKLVGAISIAPATLANAGILKGKKAACAASVNDILIRNGARLARSRVVQDDRVVTAEGPIDAKAFGEAVRDALASM